MSEEQRLIGGQTKLTPPVKSGYSATCKAITGTATILGLAGTATGLYFGFRPSSNNTNNETTTTTTSTTSTSTSTTSTTTTPTTSTSTSTTSTTTTPTTSTSTSTITSETSTSTPTTSSTTTSSTTTPATSTSTSTSTSTTPLPTTTPAPVIKDDFAQETFTTSIYNRTFVIGNQGNVDQAINGTTSFITNTPFAVNTLASGFTLSTQQLSNGLYLNKLSLSGTNSVVIKAGTQLTLIDLTVTPSDQSVNGNFPKAITTNAYNVTTVIDGKQLLLPEIGATPPVNQTYPITGSFMRDQFTTPPANNAVTGFRLETIVIQPGTGMLFSTYITDENKKWSILQTAAGQSGKEITWGLVGDCSGNANEITWTNFLSTPSLRNTIAQNIGNALKTYGNQTPFANIAIDTVGCTLVATDLLSFMQAIRNNVGNTSVSLVTSSAGPDSSIVAALKAANINLVINTSGSTPTAIQTAVNNLITAGYNPKAISLSIPAGDANAANYANVIINTNIYGAEVQNVLSPSADATVNTLNTNLNINNKIRFNFNMMAEQTLPSESGLTHRVGYS